MPVLLRDITRVEFGVTSILCPSEASILSIGILVDGAIIEVENVYRNLKLTK